MYFLRKHKNRVIVTSVAIILIIIMGFTKDERQDVSTIENVVGNAVMPVNKVGSNIRNKGSNFISTFSNLPNLLEENENLKLEIARLEEKNRDQENIIGKHEHLKKEVELLESSEYNMIYADIVSKEPGNWYDVFIIDKGKKDGVKKDDTVIQAIEYDGEIIKEGLVGRVSEVGDNWAKIVSVVDELNKVSFKTLRTQDGGVISGSLDNKLEGYLFDNKAEILVGDKLYTSGIGSKFEKDIYIGEIKKITDVEEELTKKIVVEPAVDFKKIYKVFVIRD